MLLVKRVRLLREVHGRSGNMATHCSDLETVPVLCLQLANLEGSSGGHPWVLPMAVEKALVRSASNSSPPPAHTGRWPSACSLGSPRLPTLMEQDACGCGTLALNVTDSGGFPALPFLFLCCQKQTVSHQAHVARLGLSLMLTDLESQIL